MHTIHSRIIFWQLLAIFFYCANVRWYPLIGFFLLEDSSLPHADYIVELYSLHTIAQQAHSSDPPGVKTNANCMHFLGFAKKRNLAQVPRTC